MRKTIVTLLFSIFALAPLQVHAACSAAAYRQFDFFVGKWRVTDAKGKFLGYDYVSKRLGGCVVYEEYHDGNDPGVGIGISGYGLRPGQWHQDFMDDSGFVLALDGSLQNGKMVLQGRDYPGGDPRLNRGIWTKHGDVVEELWIQSSNGGRTWKTHFHGWFHPI